MNKIYSVQSFFNTVHFTVYKANKSTFSFPIIDNQFSFEWCHVS
uniref:Uncharacterized protein n=1 Tax=Anguilla anguilla TaxID=7936 RepID=A0A0E9PSI3_ANGAN